MCIYSFLNQLPNVVLVLYFVVCIINHGMRPRPIPERSPVYSMPPWHVYYQHRQHHVLTVQRRPVLHCNGCDVVSEL